MQTIEIMFASAVITFIETCWVQSIYATQLSTLAIVISDVLPKRLYVLS